MEYSTQILSLRLFPLEGLHNLPGEVWVVPSEVTISCGLQEPTVTTPLEIQIDGHHSRPEVKGLLHNLEDFLVGNLAGSVCVHEYRRIFDRQLDLRKWRA